MSAEDSHHQRRRDRNLAIREIAALIIGGGVFSFLLWLGRDDLVKGNAQAVALIADATTVASIVTIPVALVAGGADLLSWIIRQFRRALRRLDALPGEIEEAKARSAYTSHPQANAALKPRADYGCLVVSIFLVMVALFIPTVIKWLAIAVDEDVASVEARLPLLPPEPGLPPESALPSFCEHAGGVVCRASAEAPSPEEIGLLVCGENGLGWTIFNENQLLHGYAFDDRHIPVGTPLTVRCPPT